MKVNVLFFGILKEVSGKSSETLELPGNSTVRQMLQQHRSSFERLDHLLPSIAISINQDFAGVDAVLHEGDEVGFLPPVSGGAGGIQQQLPDGTCQCSLVRDPIDVQETCNRIKRPSDGAVAMFEGIVRDNSIGRRTLYLDYEAYEAMAMTQMVSLAGEAIRNFAIRDVALAHRLGRLEIGETSIAIVVASAHRAPGLDACRWLIDTFKRTIPIWKKEYFEDGSVWAAGDPFPAELRHGSNDPAGASNPAAED